MGPGGFVMLIVGGCAIALTCIGISMWKKEKDRYGLYVATLGVALFGVCLWLAPASTWGTYDVAGVVAERYGVAVKMEDGRVIEMRDSEVIRVNEGDRVVLKCSKGAWGTGEFCGVKK